MVEHEYGYQINFSGMIGFVPHETEKRVMVLVLDGKSRHRSPSGEDLFAHVPFIYYRLDDLSDESPRRPDLSGKGYGMNFLSLEDLTIGVQTPKEPALGFELNDESAYKEPHDPDSPSREAAYSPEARNLCWIMPIHKIGKVAGSAAEDLRLDERYLEEPYQIRDMKRNRVAARLQLTRGELYVQDFQRHDYGGERRSAVYDFTRDPAAPPAEGKKPEPHSQMICTFVTYKPNMEDYEREPLKIWSKRFAFPGQKQAGAGFPELIFKTPEQVDRNVYINVWNSPFADILDIFGGPDVHKWPRPQGSRSFHAYFNLCVKESKEPGKIGLPIAEYDKDHASGYQHLTWATPDKHVACPTGRYEKAKF